MPKLSFIIPVYHTEKHLGKCIRHLREQSLGDWEAIFVLDGESAEARSIIKSGMSGASQEYQVHAIPHGGACKARNEGFKHSKGDICVFWDSDCYIEPHAARAWMEMFEKYPEHGFFYSGYTFVNEQGSLDSVPFDPFLLRIRNYISTCFPFRRALFPGWDESLESLQDWDFWLSIVEKGATGKFMLGYAFSTEYPTVNSISGKGCTNQEWLNRVDAVKRKHNLPENDTCVSALGSRNDGIHLAKLIGADYQDFPTSKPHKYKNIVQVGFSTLPQMVERHASVFNDPETKKFLFWTPENINEVYNGTSLSAIDKYSILLNNSTKMFVEDMQAEKLMKRAGFNISVLPMPMRGPDEIKEMPEAKKVLVDICADYGHVFTSLEKSLPDIELEIVDGAHKIEDFRGCLHFYLDRTMSNTIKRMILCGRHVISNVQAPFAGYVDDMKQPDIFIPQMVEKIRDMVKKPVNTSALEYYKRLLDPGKLKAMLESKEVAGVR